MSISPHGGAAAEDFSAHAARRARLAAQLGNRPALIAAGRNQPRNYLDNVFPFRASSHFLYLFGEPVAEAMGFWDGAAWTLFGRPHTAADALWHGPVPSLAETGARLGVPTRPIDELPALLAGRRSATLPVMDAATAAELTNLLGRAVTPGTLGPDDEPLAEAMIALRLFHDDAAIAGLKRAAEVTALAHRAGMAATRPGLRESNVCAAMEAQLAARGLTTAYSSIVTVHGEVLHDHSHGRALADGDLLLCDVGAESEGGWAGDVTRTWPVNGRYSTTQREMYDVVLGAQRAAIAACKPGVRYRDLHLGACRDLARGLVALGVLRGDPDELVADGVHALLFPHGVGHLIGLDVHDMEDLGDRAGYAPGRTRAQQFGLSYLRLDRDLVPGMAVTIEPGLYFAPAILNDPALAKLAGDRLDRARVAQFADVRGIRIEDDVLLTATGCEVLTAAIPKAPGDVEAAVGGG